jgi:hypothetical protein
MARARIREIIRRFPENGLKLLLEDPRNVADLLHLTGSALIGRIDFDRLELVRTTFVTRDYRNVEADLVLRAPLLPDQQRSAMRRRPSAVWIYILIEHQSEKDDLMCLRLPDYVIQIFKHQVRAWQRAHGTRRRVRLQPVLPLVFYTGTQRWEAIGQLEGLMERGEQFAAVTPHLEPLYLSLGETPPERLEEAGGYFGRILRLVQQRKTLAEEFGALVAEVVRDLEAMPAGQRLRWLELLSYILALVYHERRPDEQSALRETIEASVETDQHRKELFAMGRTIADQLKAEGRKEGRKEGREQGRKQGRQEGEVHGRRQTLLLQLRKRFGALPPEVAARVEQTADVGQLDAWLERFATATRLEEVGIMSES